jgi:23S rRNA (adenine2503-C2)-methyltransferase
MQAGKKDIRTLTNEALEQCLKEIGQPAFRAKQIAQWIWQKECRRFDQMTNLPKALRASLAEHFDIRPIQLSRAQKSADGTIKCTFRLHDGHLIESVLIPTENRMTACVSSQVGCSLTCKFCATGYMKRERNLTAAEIYDQVIEVNRLALQHYGKALTNIVYMGMGEPLLNYSEVMRSTEIISSADGWNFSAKRITVSTAGIAKMIKRIGDEQRKFNLALSLHAADDSKRSQIMPINEQNSLAALIEALQYYYQQTKQPVTFEYIVFRDFNDSLDDARKLLKIVRKVPSKVNIIEYNPINKAQFQNTTPERLAAFAGFLEQQGVVVKVRRSRGKDIDAACGQLATKENEKSHA